MSDRTIKPGVGYGGLVLGMSASKVRSLLGEPDENSRVVHADGSVEVTWIFEEEALEISFYDDDGDKLGSITVAHDDATLSGIQPLGLGEQDFLELTESLGIGPIEFEEEHEDLQMRNFVWDEGGLHFWVVEGILDSLTVLPIYDELGVDPLWPKLD